VRDAHNGSRLELTERQFPRRTMRISRADKPTNEDVLQRTDTQTSLIEVSTISGTCCVKEAAGSNCMNWLNRLLERDGRKGHFWTEQELHLVTNGQVMILM